MSAVYGPVEHAVRTEIYRYFVDTGQAPSTEEVATAIGLDEGEAGAAFESLDELHAIVLKRGTRQIERALPFSASPTSHQSRVGGRQYWANCAWDALGIPAALNADGEIRSDGFAGGDTVHLEVRDGRLLGDQVYMGFVVPARQWWHDIGFT